MIVHLSDNIISPLGRTTQENFDAVILGETKIREHRDFDLPSPFFASMFEERISFTELCISSAKTAIASAKIDPKSEKTVIIISTTKGENLELLESAKKIATAFENPNEPIVVSNACTSGVCAQIVAWRLLETGAFENAVVVGGDVLSRFIVSGFQSFGAVADENCRPFDKNRKGLNLGEAVATIVLGVRESLEPGQWALCAGSIHNDANHLSAPSRTAEGSLRCLMDVLETAEISPSDLAFVSLHGTGTAYNDQMESVAIRRAGLESVPVFGLKGYFGHTLGAAGLVETVISLHAADCGKVPATRGFNELGTEEISISNEIKTTDKTAFVKLLSGFGGCNAAVLYSKNPKKNSEKTAFENGDFRVTHTVEITPDVAKIDGEIVAEVDENGDILTQLYRKEIGDYPKFFKMDTLSRLGFVATQILLKKENSVENSQENFAENRAVLLANNSASIAVDKLFLASIDPEFFPSPKLFVYTLPNIVNGEIAIFNKFFGETNFFVLPNFQSLKKLTNTMFSTTKMTSAVIGWVECKNEKEFNANLKIVWKN